MRVGRDVATNGRPDARGAAEPSSPAAWLEHVERTRRSITVGPSSDATARQHARGRLTARERIDLLLDRDSFVELDAYARHRSRGFGLDESRPHTDGVITGWGTVDGREVVVYAHDFRIFGGALGEVFASKVHKAQDLSLKIGAPIVGISDGVGARIQEGVGALDGYGGVFTRNVAASGVVPQVSVLMGPCAGGAAYSPALTDFVFAIRDLSNVFITGPDVVRSVTGEIVTKAELGGAELHATTTGVATFLHDDEHTCLAAVRQLLGFLPSNNAEHAPERTPSDDPSRWCPELRDLLPERSNVAYDIRTLLEVIVDHGELLECSAEWAKNIVCGLARLGGRPVGIVASQPSVLAGAIDIEAAEKGARFVRTCDAFNLPILTFVDTPGFLPGVSQEHGGIVRHGAKLLFAYCEATVPRVQVIVRKAYGGAYIVMDSRGVGTDLSFAWPTSEVAVMGAGPAVDVLFRREIADAADPQATRQRLVEQYLRDLSGPYQAAERGMVDDLIDPAATRRILHRSLRLLASKRHTQPDRKHGNVPL